MAKVSKQARGSVRNSTQAPAASQVQPCPPVLQAGPAQHSSQHSPQPHHTGSKALRKAKPLLESSHSKDCSEVGWGGKSHKSALQHLTVQTEARQESAQICSLQTLSPCRRTQRIRVQYVWVSQHRDCPVLSWLQLGQLSSFPAVIAALCRGLRLSTELTTPIFWLSLHSAYTELRNLGTSWAPLSRWGQPLCAFSSVHPIIIFLSFFVPLNCLDLNPYICPFFPSILSPTPVKGEGAKGWEVLS